MKAVGYRQSFPIREPESLIDTQIPDPEPMPRDLLVRVRAVAVNPIDTKIRRRQEPPNGDFQVLGWDTVGTVIETGAEVTLFKSGDKVWYSGSLTRPGSNSELHTVDERIAALKPETIDDAHAAALPLTGLTAWELLFERLKIAPGKQHRDETLLIVGAAGGVGSILIQLARRLTGMTVIGTASRPETREWAKSMGTHHVIDHSLPLSDELLRIGIPKVTHAASLTHTDVHFPELVKSLSPHGKIALIDDPGPIDVNLLKQKSISLHWEAMFTKILFETPDMISHHRILCELADLVDEGMIKSTFHDHFGVISAENLKRAHERIESGTCIGKIVLEHF